MFDVFAQNGIGGEAIIWLIIAFFWVVAQLFSRAKEKAQQREAAQGPEDKPPPPADQQERSFETEMRRFLENIGAEPAEDEEDMAPEPMPQRSSRPTRQQRAAERRRASEPSPPTPPPLPSRPTAAAPVAHRESRLGDMDTTIDESALDAEQAYALREMREQVTNAFVDPRTLLVNLNYLRMNMEIVPITGLSATSERRPRPAIKGRRALRDAITTQMILSNPLAMGEDKASFTKRVV